MAELLDRAKKVLFPETEDGGGGNGPAKESKRRARATTHSCSLLASSDGTLSISDVTTNKENRAPRRRGDGAMDSLAGGTLASEKSAVGGAAQNPKRGFRKRDKRGSLESRSSRTSTVSRTRQRDSLAAVGENVDGLEIESNTSVISSNNETKGRRRRGRGHHPVSSLVQTGNTNKPTTSRAEPSRKATVSSLMNLSSSTQKPKATTSKQQNSNNEMDLISSIQSMNLNNKFSSPIVHKHRPFALPGECTSPPGVLHRLSSVSNNIFSRSPAMFSPSKTPGSARPRRKRMDKKKTPDKLTGMGECGLLNDDADGAPSPMITELAVSPRFGRRQRRSDKINNPKKQHEDTAQELNVCNTSFDCDGQEHTMMSPDVDPHDLVTSPLANTMNPVSKLGDAEFICAKANLFPASNEPAALSKTAISGQVRGSSVIDVESAAPRVDKPTPLMEASEANVNKTGYIRGSAVFSVQKARPVSKPSLTKQEDDKPVAKWQANKKKKSKSKAKKTSAPAAAATKPSASRSSKPKPSAQEGIRKSSRESKATDRLTVESWDNNDKRKVRFTNDDAFSSSDDSGDECDTEHLTKLQAENNSSNNKAADKQPELSLPLTKKDTDIKNSNSSPLQAGQWSNEEISILRNAQCSVDPTLASYWEEIAALVNGKSASECREKWFSLVATPRGRPPKDSKKQQLHQPDARPNNDADEESCDDEDDLFHSTPMREALIDNANDALIKNINRSSLFGSSVGLSPCVPALIANQAPGTSSLIDRRIGYKTYIDKLRKDLHPSQNNAKKDAQHKALKGYTTAHIDSRDWGKVLAHGSAKLTLHEESEDDVDDFFDEEEED